MKSCLDLSAFGTCGFVPKSFQSRRLSEGGQKQKPVETEGQRPVVAELSKQFGICSVAPGQSEKEGKKKNKTQR